LGAGLKVLGIKNSLFCGLVACKKGSFSSLENAGDFSLKADLTEMIPLGGCFDAGFTA
jgi:hypothetical protein